MENTALSLFRIRMRHLHPHSPSDYFDVLIQEMLGDVMHFWAYLDTLDAYARSQIASETSRAKLQRELARGSIRALAVAPRKPEDLKLIRTYTAVSAKRVLAPLAVLAATELYLHLPDPVALPYFKSFLEK